MAMSRFGVNRFGARPLRLAAVAVLVIAGAAISAFVGPARAADGGISPQNPTYSYDAGPFTFLNVAGLAAGTYTIQVTKFWVQDSSFHMAVALTTLNDGATSATSAAASELSFTNGAPATFERSSGEPSMTVDPANGDLYADIPLGAPTN